MAPAGVSVYFAFRSPFSWLAIRRLRAAVPRAAAVMEFVPYWEPDPSTDGALSRRGVSLPYVPMSKAKHLYILQDTKRLAARLGVEMRWPIDVHPRWDLPHFAWLQARRLGVGEKFYDAVVAARWQEGLNICDPTIIRALTRGIGLDEDVLVGAVEDAGVREEAVACLVRAYEDDIFGVPYFRVGRQRFWGFDRVEQFLEAYLARAGQAPIASSGDPLAPVPVGVREAVGAYDTDAAGGCG